MSRTRMVVMLIGGLAVLAGCADRPTSAELTESIVRAAQNDPSVSVTNEEAGCIAEQLLGTGLSDTTMSGLAENFDEPEVLSAEVDRVEPAVADAAAQCLGQP